MTAETFDAVLAEMRCPLVTTRDIPHDVVERMFRNIADRLAAAHAAEVAEQQAQLDHANCLCTDYRYRIAELEVAYLHYRQLAERADAATALLRECLQFVPDDLAARVAGPIRE